MEVDMTAEEVMTQIQQLESNGEPLRKKQVKQKHPELMRNALYFFFELAACGRGKWNK
jgi:hypothetical protein